MNNKRIKARFFEFMAPTRITSQFITGEFTKFFQKIPQIFSSALFIYLCE